MKNAKGCVASKEKESLNYQEGGQHYVDHPIQPVVYCYKNKLNNIDSNIVKYATRNKPGESNKARYLKIIHYAIILLGSKNGDKE